MGTMAAVPVGCAVAVSGVAARGPFPPSQCEAFRGNLPDSEH